MLHLKKKKWTSAVLIGISLCMIACSLLSFSIYQAGMRSSLAEKSQQELEQYTKQSAILFNRILEDDFKQLDSIALFCGINKNSDGQKLLDLLHQNNSGSTTLKIGIAGNNGLLYTGSSNPVDISSYPFFEQALRGERVVSDVIHGLVDSGDAIVLAEPIRTNGETAGVVCAIYDTSAFSTLFGTSQFPDVGATMIMQADGTMVSGYQGMENYSTFYEALEQMEFLGDDTLESLRQRIESGESGLFTYYRNGRARYLYFQPVGVNDWHMLSLVLAESMDKQLNTLSAQSFTLMGVNIFFYAVLLLVVLQLIRFGRIDSMEYQKDALTLLQNKRSARLMMEHYLRHEGKKKMHACFFIDIDNFKHINDTLGHNAGDNLLVSFSKKLKTNFREADLLSRFGGDEFIVWMKNIPSREIAATKAEALRKLIVSDGSFATTISIGISCYPDDGSTYDACLQQADEALYQAKKLGKNRYCFYDKNSRKE